MKISMNNIELYIFKYLWILILSPKPVQMGVYILLLFILVHNKRIKFDMFSCLIILYSCVQFLAILVQLITKHPDAARIFAAMNTASIWIVATMFYLVFKNREDYSQNEIRHICLYIKINFCILFLVYVISIVTDRAVINIGSFSYCLERADYLATGRTLRFAGLMDTVLCPSHFFIIQFPLLVYGMKLCNDNIWKILFWGLLGMIPVIATHSRTGIVIGTMQFLIAFLYVLSSYIDKKMIYGIISIFCISAMVFMLISFSEISKYAYLFFNSRASSNNMRFTIYQNSISLALKKSPIIGMGIKYMMGRYPYGSHSTYIGVFYKVGILGSVLFVIAFYILFKTMWNALRKTLYGKTVIFMLFLYLLFLVFADLDATDWITVSFFSVCGLILNKGINSSEMGQK